MKNANVKFDKGYAATGVGMAMDARHGFILPNSVGDLQKGERYVSDYLLLLMLNTPLGTSIWIIY